MDTGNDGCKRQMNAFLSLFLVITLNELVEFWINLLTLGLTRNQIRTRGRKNTIGWTELIFSFFIYIKRAAIVRMSPPYARQTKKTRSCRWFFLNYLRREFFFVNLTLRSNFLQNMFYEDSIIIVSQKHLFVDFWCLFP